MKEVNITDLKSLLNITTPADIKSFAINDVYEDDHQQCAELEINGVYVEFMWYDNVGFIEYWDESKKAFNALRDAIAAYVNQRVESMANDGECDEQEAEALLADCNRYFEARRAEYAAARK